MIRPINPLEPTELAWVAARMRLTLIEVLGVERGQAMYTLDWLERRVAWHLDPEQCVGEVFLAEDPGGAIVGHTIVRIEVGPDGLPFGLFSTTYVEPAARNHAVATALLDRGEGWMRDHGLQAAMTHTSPTNTKLKNLYLGRGYNVVATTRDFITLRKAMGAEP